MPPIENGIANVALRERGGPMCEAGERIPTSSYPLYAESFVGSIAIGATSVSFELEAERDYLFTDLSISVELSDGTSVPAFVDNEYCNTQYLQNSNVRVWQYCCQRKPVYLVGVRENKKLRFTVFLFAANAAEVTVTLSLSGFQGRGCCD